MAQIIILMKNSNTTGNSQNGKSRIINIDEEDSSDQYQQVQVNVDQIILKLLDMANNKPGKKVQKMQITQKQLHGIAKTAKDIFLEEDILLELQPPIQVCGDIHGQYYDLLRVFAYGGQPPSSTYLFLGDYVDRGQLGIQTISLLYCFKIKYPNKIFLLRGNHQSASISKIYGFYNECKKRYSIKLWKSFLGSFSNLPVAAVIGGRIICMHGGLSPNMLDISNVRSITRPTQIPDQGLICDLLWADPTVETTGWADSERGCSYVFGSDVTTSFLKANDLDLVCRAHQVVEDGYEFCHRKKVVTLFSAPNYCGEFNNAGAFMKIDGNLRCSFHILKPDDKKSPFKNSKPRPAQ